MTLPLVLARSAAIPVTFAGTVGLFTPAASNSAARDLGVLFASPWGLEEMCTRKFWRILSEKLSDHGFASLRFDYPDTGDALDVQNKGQGFETWSSSLVTAAEVLRRHSGCRRIMVLSQGVGSVIAMDAAKQLTDIEAMAFLAPVVSGRAYLRELAVWSNVVDENLGLRADQRHKEGVSIASLTMPAAVANALRSADLMSVAQVPAPHCLVLARPERPADAALGARLQTLGADVRTRPFEGYQNLVSDPVISRMPLDVADMLIEWIVDLPSARTARTVVPTLPGAALPLAGDGFLETPIRFGQYHRLSGVFCEAEGQHRGATVILVISAYDRHCGWGRTTLALARDLARAGISSLRFDTANAADSPSRPGEPEQVLYGTGQNLDLQEAVNFLEARGCQSIIVAGRCSGAYLALQVGEVDARIAGVVAVNVATFRWKDGRSVEDAVRNAGRSLGEYGTRALRFETLKRLMRGEVNVASAAENIMKGLFARIRNRASGAIRFWLPHGRSVLALFRHLQAARKPVALIYSENDYGLEEFDYYFGQGGGRLMGFDNVSVTMIPACDHNLTPAYARETYLAAVREMALQAPQSGPSSETRGLYAAK